MNKIIALAALMSLAVGCSDKPRHIEVSSFYETCRRIYGGGDFDHFEVYVDIDESGALKPRCTLKDYFDDGESIETHLYESELEGIRFYLDSRKSK